jgi:copper chaperone NosL
MRVGAGSLAAAALLLLAACRGGLEPQAIPLDRVNCARCGMLVSDPTSAAEVVFTNSDALFYDDLGCLASARIVADHPFELWVRVDGGTAWKRASEAFYAKPVDARTPMGYGILAFSSPEKARARDREARARDWQEIERETPSRVEGREASAGKDGA